MTDIIARYRAAAAKVRELEAAASKGPWDVTFRAEGNNSQSGDASDRNLWWGNDYEGHKFDDNDARLICAARNLLPALLDAGDALANALEALYKSRDKGCADCAAMQLGGDPFCYFHTGDALCEELAALTEALEKEGNS